MHTHFIARTANLTLLYALLCPLLLGCAPTTPAELHEHAENAAMSTALITTLYRPDGTGGVTMEQKALPWEDDMGSYALSYILDDANITYDCRVTHGEARVNIGHFPVFETAAQEQAAIVCIVNTLVSLPGIDTVLLSFDGEQLVALKNGTPVGQAFNALPLVDAFDATVTP